MEQDQRDKDQVRDEAAGDAVRDPELTKFTAGLGEDRDRAVGAACGCAWVNPLAWPPPLHRLQV